MTWVLIPIVALAIPIVLVPVVLGICHARNERELEHAERMKALELGRALPGDESGWTPARACVVIGAGVPIGIFLIAWLASERLGCQDQIWTAAEVVGLSSVVSGALLASRQLDRREGVEDTLGVTFGKPVVDPDAFDVVGRRG